MDCAPQEPECPIDAVRAEGELPEEQQALIALNAELAEHTNWKQTTEMKTRRDATHLRIL